MSAPLPFPEMWLVMWFDVETGAPLGYQMFHPNRAAAEAKVKELRAIDPPLTCGGAETEFRVVRYVAGEVLP